MWDETCKFNKICRGNKTFSEKTFKTPHIVIYDLSTLNNVLIWDMRN